MCEPTGRPVPRRDRRGRRGRHHHRGGGPGRSAVQRRAARRDERPGLRSRAPRPACWPTNEHFSLYLYPFSDTCQVNTWNRTDEPQTPRGDLREFLNISPGRPAGGAGSGNSLAYARLLPLSRPGARFPFLIKRGSNLVLESNKAFNRSIYHLHQELEFTVPFDDDLRGLRPIPEALRAAVPPGLPYTLIELRFTPRSKTGR